MDFRVAGVRRVKRDRNCVVPGFTLGFNNKGYLSHGHPKNRAALSGIELGTMGCETQAVTGRLSTLLHRAIPGN